MVFSDTTAKDGMIQTFEFWTRMPDGNVTGTLLKQVTSRINSAFDKIMPLLLAHSGDNVRWDDLNHTDAPIGFIDMVADQNDYKITEDGNSLDILNINYVRILQKTGDTQRVDLRRIYVGTSSNNLFWDVNYIYPINNVNGWGNSVAEILNPNTDITGTPTGYLELGNRLYLNILPDSSITNGIEIGFGREQSYFVSGDTTKELGIPLPFHELLVLYAALDWNMVNRTDDRNLITLLRERINEIKKSLKEFIDLRNPKKQIMRPRRINFI